jgi:hypothetical protein
MHRRSYETPQTQKIRPYFACAILRNLKFTPRSYASFIDLQDKLHQNLCRRRQLVSIGTHDLDSIRRPFRYDARPPQQINFVPLGKDKSYTGEELMTLYEVHIILSVKLSVLTVLFSPRSIWRATCISSVTRRYIPSSMTRRTVCSRCPRLSTRNTAKSL